MSGKRWSSGHRREDQGKQTPTPGEGRRGHKREADLKAEELEAPAASEDRVWNTSENMKIGRKFPNLLPISHSQVTAYLLWRETGRVGVRVWHQAIESARGRSLSTTPRRWGESTPSRETAQPKRKVPETLSFGSPLTEWLEPTG